MMPKMIPGMAISAETQQKATAMVAVRGRAIRVAAGSSGSATEDVGGA
jgi:hypothetical protein